METKANKIFLINPWIYDFAAYDFWIKPIGLLSIGSILRSFGYKILLIDCLDRYYPDLLKLQGREKPRSKKDGTGKFHREFVQKPACLEDIPRNYCPYGWPLNLFERKLQEI
ncbi:MAG: radical SAM protein, partial [Candidatus Zixiibacteriota bacterium]